MTVVKMEFLDKEQYRKKSGIYKIVNKTNGKFYVGSAYDFHRRWLNHLSAMKRKDHFNDHILNYLETGSPDDFTFEVIEEVCLENLREREQYFIDLLGSLDPSIGYNLAPKVDDVTVTKPETKEKLSKSRKSFFESMTEDERREYTAKRFKKTGVHNHTGKKQNKAWAIKSKEAGVSAGQVLRRFTDEDVVSIVKRILLGDSCTEIAKTYEVSASTICSIFSKKRNNDYPPVYKPILLKINYNGSSISDIRNVKFAKSLILE